MSTATTYTRYPLGLPAGSVRSLLTLMVVGLICGMILLSQPPTYEPPIPPFLICLLFLIVGSFFSAHGNSMNKQTESPPLGLPRGTIRLIIIAALIATAAYKITNDYDGWKAQAELTVEKIKEQPQLPFVVMGGFLLGVIVRSVIGRNPNSPVYQDLVAWVALLAMVGMVAEVLITTVINPSLRTATQIDLGTFEAILAAVIAFYFAARA